MIKALRILFLFIGPLSAISQPVTLEVRAFAQGFYSPATSKMVAVADPVNYPNLCDTATLVLIDSSSGQSVYCDQVLFSIQGYGTSLLPSGFYNNSYLIGVRFRNTLHIVSLNTLLLDSANKSIDLTVAANLCCSFDTTYGVATAYSGDVNHDGTIDATDLSVVFTDNSNGVTGYVVTDLNGDGIVDNLDETIADDNSILFLYDDYAFVCVQTGIGTLNSSTLEVNAFPNPFSGKFKIELANIHKKIEVTIFDVMGKIQIRRSFDSEEELSIETGNLIPGLYIIKVIADKEQGLLKLLSN